MSACAAVVPKIVEPAAAAEVAQQEVRKVTFVGGADSSRLFKRPREK